RYRNAPRGRLLDIDIVGRDRHRIDSAQLRVCPNDVTVDRIVQQTEQKVARAHTRDQLVLGNDGAVVRVDRDVGNRAQADERAFNHRLGHEYARAHQFIQRTMPATPSTATCEPSGIRRVASSTPSTMGMPRSRASDARCDVEPPSSATTPATRGNTQLAAAPATLVPKARPGAPRDSSHSQWTTTARPAPQPIPAGWPLSPGCLSQISSGTVIGSTCSGRACSSLKPVSSSAHSISTGMPK